VYGDGFAHHPLLSMEDGELRETWNEPSAACREVVAHAAEYCRIEIIHFEPGAVVRIRITHSRGLDQPTGAGEEKALADVMDSLPALGVKRT
jgi:hypothetical protein